MSSFGGHSGLFSTKFRALLQEIQGSFSGNSGLSCRKFRALLQEIQGSFVDILGSFEKEKHLRLADASTCRPLLNGKQGSFAHIQGTFADMLMTDVRRCYWQTSCLEEM